MLGRDLKRLAKHSAIYSLGGFVSRVLAVLLLPLYTHYLGTVGFGKIETVVAMTTVLVIVLRLGISSAFFRYYFDSDDPGHRIRVLRTSFWFTMTMATAGLVAGWALAEVIADGLAIGHDPWLVRAGFVLLWAQMNYEQMTSLFRVEERSVQFVVASLANVLITVGSTVTLVVGFHKGPLGAVIGNFTGTLIVYTVLLGYRREQLGLQFDRELFRKMNHFGMPLVPSALALWAINFIDRIFIAHYKGQAEVGVYSLAARVAAVIVFLMIAFRLAWPAFAYSIEDDARAKRAYSFVLTYLLFLCSWAALGLGLLSPWLVDVLAQGPGFDRSAKAVGLLSFAATAYAGYTVLAIGVGRARQTQFNWVVSGVAAVVNIALNFVLIPRYGMIGAAISTLAAYAVLFLGMAANSQRVFPVPYQWRRVVTLVAVAAGLLVLGDALNVPLAVALMLAIAYPLALLPAGFYLPVELQRLRRLLP